MPSTFNVPSHLDFTATLDGVHNYYSCWVDADTDLPETTELVTTQPGSGPSAGGSGARAPSCPRAVL